MSTLLIAHKVLEDCCFPNTIFAKLNGLEIEVVNKCEWEVLEVLGWEVGVRVEEMDLFVERISREVDDVVNDFSEKGNGLV